MCYVWCAPTGIKCSTEQLFYAIFHFCIGIRVRSCFSVVRGKNFCCGCFVYKQTNGNARKTVEYACTQFECYFCIIVQRERKALTSTKLKIARQTKRFCCGSNSWHSCNSNALFCCRFNFSETNSMRNGVARRQQTFRQTQWQLPEIPSFPKLAR